MSISPTFVTRFFQLVMLRQFTEAERVFERLKKPSVKTEWNRGYFIALNGMLLANRSKTDRYVFFSVVNALEKTDLHKLRLEFLNQANSSIHSDYDRGFFSAWAEYIRILLKMKLPEKS